MASQADSLRRRSLSILHPETWWDYLFVRALERAERWLENPTAKRLARVPWDAFRLLVWGVSPAAEINFEHRPNWRHILVVALGSALAAFLFSFGLNYLFASLAGTLSGSDPKRVYYLGDTHNIGIYTVIAPLYIACASVIIYVYLSSAMFMRRFDEKLGPDEMMRLALQLAVFAILLLASDALVQYRYYTEIVEKYAQLPHVQTKKYEYCKELTYWFVDRYPNDKLALNLSGMFYFIGNFVRLGVVAAAAFCFIGASTTLIRLGARIAPDSGQSYDIPSVREMLYSFSVIELWTKGLYFVLSIHAKVWGNSCLTGQWNIQIAGAVVFVIGWAALTIPRNFVEYRLWRLLSAQTAAGSREGLPDLRNQQTRWVYTVASSVFYLAAATLFLISQDGPVGPQTLLGLLGAFGLGWLLRMFGIHP